MVIGTLHSLLDLCRRLIRSCYVGSPSVKELEHSFLSLGVECGILLDIDVRDHELVVIVVKLGALEEPLHEEIPGASLADLRSWPSCRHNRTL